MKAGILTLHQADSYGAVLQAYALQQTLLKLGVASEFISITPEPAGSSAHPLTQAAPVFARLIQTHGQKLNMKNADYLIMIF